MMTLRLIRLSLVATCLCSVAPSLFAETLDERARQLVVRIDATFPGVTKFGAGIIFARANGRVYIATANHVVRDTQAATSVSVSFGTLPGEQFSGSVLAPLQTQLDMGVVYVPDTNLPRDLFPTRVIGNVGLVKRGDAMFPVGHPNGASWEIPVVPDHVSQAVAGTIRFQSGFVRNGNSGGALMDEMGNLFGMVIEDQQPDASAISIDTVLNTLRNAGYPIQLVASVPAAPAASNNTVPRQTPAPPQVSETCPLKIESTPSGGSIYLDGVSRGATPTTIDLRRESARVNLRIEKDGYKSYSTDVDCQTKSISRRLDVTTADISLRYLGDFGSCVLNLQVGIGNKSVHPTSNLFTVKDVPEGPARYTIGGAIGCPGVGTCVATGNGNIDVKANETYDISWANVLVGSCLVTLTKSSF
jgi:S1-C subfamily serine protease